MVKPYQTSFPGIGINEIASIDFSDEESKRYSNRTKIGNHTTCKAVYLNSSSMIVKDFVSEFATKLIEKSEAIISRLEDIYEYIYFDEVQDLTGYDLDVVISLLKSKINVIMVGDPLQSTLKTNTNLRKNRNISGCNIENISKEFHMKLELKTTSRRCNDAICIFASLVSHANYKITSDSKSSSEHEGVFLIKEQDAANYFEYLHPQFLCWDKKNFNKYKFEGAINFGASKGMTFNHTLLTSTKPFKKFILNGTPLDSPGKYYVAVTRARYSVCIIIDSFPSNSDAIEIFHAGSFQIPLYRLY